jgi:phage-related protein
MFTRVWTVIRGGFSSAWAWFKGLPAQFGQLGRDILNGLINGITSRVDAAVTAIGGVASKLKAKFTGMLGIQSPSRVFAGYGMNIGEGAALGILRGVPGVQRAVSKLSALTASGALATAVHAVGLPAPGGAGSAGQLTIHFAPQITIQGGGNAQQTAQMTVAEMERMLKRVIAEQQRRTIG